MYVCMNVFMYVCMYVLCMCTHICRHVMCIRHCHVFVYVCISKQYVVHYTLYMYHYLQHIGQFYAYRNTDQLSTRMLSETSKSSHTSRHETRGLGVCSQHPLPDALMSLALARILRLKPTSRTLGFLATISALLRHYL